MNSIYRFRLDVDQYPALDVSKGSKYAAEQLNELLDADERLSDTWTAPKLEWCSSAPKHLPDVVGCIFSSSSFAVRGTALNFFRPFVPLCGELLGARLNGGEEVWIFHLFAADVFPAGHDHTTELGDFVTKVESDNLRPIFREIIHADDGGQVPGVYRHCTEDFRECYIAAGLSGIVYEPFWPLDNRLSFLVQKIKERAAARERGRAMKGNASPSSPMPMGRPRMPKVTWKKKQHPDPEQLAAYLWQAVIDQRMSGHWLGDAVGANTPDAPGITKLAAEAVTRLLDMGVDRNVLCHLARAICFEAIRRTFGTLEETGITWPDAKPDWESLQMAMTQAATLGKDGSLGGWPPK